MIKTHSLHSYIYIYVLFSTPVRLTPISKTQSGNTSYAPSSTTYLYHDQYASNLPMHLYNTSSSSSGFTTTQLRPVSCKYNWLRNLSKASHSMGTNPVFNSVIYAWANDFALCFLVN